MAKRCRFVRVAIRQRCPRLAAAADDSGAAVIALKLRWQKNEGQKNDD
jgi:hypothetical protein